MTSITYGRKMQKQHTSVSFILSIFLFYATLNYIWQCITYGTPRYLQATVACAAKGVIHVIMNVHLNSGITCSCLLAITLYSAFYKELIDCYLQLILCAVVCPFFKGIDFSFIHKDVM